MNGIFRSWNVLDYSVNMMRDWSWPTALNLGMNEWQYQAFYAALTSAFCLIQGPPGTGKTFVGLKILKVLLDNVPKNKRPILIVCQTNHALDQFLEGILKVTKKVIRVGSSSDNDVVEKYGLRGALYSKAVQKERKSLGTTKLTKDIDRLSIDLITKSSQNKTHIVSTIKEYMRKSKMIEAARQRADVQVMKMKADVIGMTTTCAARMHLELESVKPAIGKLLHPSNPSPFFLMPI